MKLRVNKTLNTHLRNKPQTHPTNSVKMMTKKTKIAIMMKMVNSQRLWLCPPRKQPANQPYQITAAAPLYPSETPNRYLKKTSLLSMFVQLSCFHCFDLSSLFFFFLSFFLGSIEPGVLNSLSVLYSNFLVLFADIVNIFY